MDKKKATSIKNEVKRKTECAQAQSPPKSGTDMSKKCSIKKKSGNIKEWWKEDRLENKAKPGKSFPYRPELRKFNFKSKNSPKLKKNATKEGKSNNGYVKKITNYFERLGQPKIGLEKVMLGVEKAANKTKIRSFASLGGGGLLISGHKKGVGDTEASVGNCIVPDTVVQTDRISGADVRTGPATGRDTSDRNNGNRGIVVKMDGISSSTRPRRNSDKFLTPV